MPMKICSRTFTLVDEHLAALGYEGPVGLSCDDSKLFKSWRIYWDNEQKSHFVIGGVGEPMRIANPEALKQIIKDGKIAQATKVCSSFAELIVSFRLMMASI